MRGERHVEADRKRRPGCRLLVLLLALLLLPLQPFSGPALGAATSSVEIVTHADRAGALPLDRALLRAAFTMRLRQWPDGRPLRVFVLPDSHPLHDRFCRELLGTYPYVLRTAWDRMVYTGTGFAPVVVYSEDEMRRRVQASPGAIGYVSRPPAEGLGAVKGVSP